MRADTASHGVLLEGLVSTLNRLLGTKANDWFVAEVVCPGRTRPRPITAMSTLSVLDAELSVQSVCAVGIRTQWTRSHAWGRSKMTRLLPPLQLSE